MPHTADQIQHISGPEYFRSGHFRSRTDQVRSRSDPCFSGPEQTWSRTAKSRTFQILNPGTGVAKMPHTTVGCIW